MMTDKLDIIIDKRLDEVSASNDPCFETAARLVAEEWAAAEVNRFLDKLDATTTEGLEFSWSRDCAKHEFEWRHVEYGRDWDEIVHESGTTKASLLEYVGFSVEGDGE